MAPVPMPPGAALPTANSPPPRGVPTVGHANTSSLNCLPEPGDHASSSDYTTSEDDRYESFSDDDLSSWGSLDEIWDTDSDYYDTEEEEEALSGKLPKNLVNNFSY